MPPQPAPPPIKGAIPAVHPKSTKTEFEVLNPKGVAAAPSAEASSSKTEEEESDELPQLTPALVEFSNMPLRGYEESWEYVKAHRDVIVPGASDALLVSRSAWDTEHQNCCPKLRHHLTAFERLPGRLGTSPIPRTFRSRVKMRLRADDVAMWRG